MPPKGPAPKKSSAADTATLELRNTLDGVKRECEGVERLMVICSEQMQRTNLESLNLKKKIAELNSKFDESEKFTNEKCIGMNKLYRSGQAQLLARIETHQASIDELRKQLDEAREQLERTKAEKDSEIAEKTRKINEQKQRMEEMAIAFGIKLKETLERMSQHIHGREED
eukprot:GILI01014671.1.p1 GENE.GILI01014671.1~~GILI01014671.1.p1  ORF type:complete len:182 (-),score=44.37 GILI01014671.1:96-608(-)